MDSLSVDAVLAGQVNPGLLKISLSLLYAADIYSRDLTFPLHSFLISVLGRKILQLASRAG
ncbi:MAG: hypothetical protein V2B20_11390 [Pseudomonadota bacterium]